MFILRGNTQYFILESPPYLESELWQNTWIFGLQNSELYCFMGYFVNTDWWEIDIYTCYSLVKINIVSIFMYKNNQSIWHHNSSTSFLCVTGQLWWYLNARLIMIWIMIYLVTHWQIASLTTRIFLIIVSHTLFCICYIFVITSWYIGV